MDWKYFKQIMRVFFGVCLILVSGAVLIYNVFLNKTGYDVGLGMLDMLVFLGGLLLTLFSAAALPGDRQA